MTFEEAYKSLNKAQKVAVDTIDGPMMVMAGPGTGKTQLLAMRAANILNKTDTLPQNILCLTYTEVGTRNMRDRINQLIGKQAYDIRISTYHSFGSEIIRQYREYFTNFNSDQAIDVIGQNQIMHEIYDELPASNLLWRVDTYLKDALDIISELKRALLKPEDIIKIAKDNQRSIELISKLATNHLRTLVRIDKKALPLFENLFITMQAAIRDHRLPNKFIALDSMATTALAKAILDTKNTGKTNTITAFKNQWLAKNNQNDWVLAGSREVNKLMAVAEIYKRYLQKLESKKMYDYDDMILQAIDGLKANDELRFTLQEQYQYIMLDEFQDTNLAQLKLIELLTNNPASEGRPNILAVGDDDQAIFSFQGADLTNMIRYHKMYKDVLTIPLTENWRSHNDLLQASKNIAGQIEERLHTQLGFADKILVAKNNNLPKNAILERREFKSDISEISWVAKQIKQLIKNDQKPEQIAVLAPKHRYLEALVPYMQNANIPIRYDKRENILVEPRILEIINMAELVIALAKGDQKLANTLWPAILSGDEWDLPTSKIWQLSWEADKNRYSTGVVADWQSLMMQDESLKPIALFFAKLSILSSTETLETMLDYITGVTEIKLNEKDLKVYRSPYFEFYFSDKSKNNTPTEFVHLLSNLTVLRQHLREYNKIEERPLSLNDLLSFVYAYRFADEKLLNTSPYHSSQNAVQLLTAYGAKGLEFEVVFILAASDEVWGMKSRSQSSNIALPQNMQTIRHAGASKDERKRLFYVAMTRAKHTLYITNFTQNFAGINTTRLEFLDESERDGEVISNTLPILFNSIKQIDHDAPEIASLEQFWQTKHIDGLQQPNLIDLLKPKIETFQLSATHVNSFIDLVYGGPQEFFMNTILRFPKAPTPDGQYGNAIHETLEYIQLNLKKEGNLLSVKKALNVFEQKLLAKRLSSADFKRQLERGQITLTNFLPKWQHNFNARNISEVNFKHEGAFIDNVHLAGKLDHLFIDKANMSIEVVDFKTGKAYNHWAQNVKLHKYRQQLMFYKILVEASHTYKDYKVSSGRLVFVEPIDSDDLAELYLDFNISEIEKFKLLIKAVWQRIMDLDFLDVSEYEPTIKGIRAFEDYLIDNYR